MLLPSCANEKFIIRLIHIVVTTGRLGLVLVSTMPRMSGINSKALEAKQRKKEQQAALERKREAEALDKFWEDNDKLILAKQERKLEAQRRQQDKLQRKQELRQLVEKEEAELVSNKTCAKGPAVPKVTRAQILRVQALQAEARAKEAASREENEYCDVSRANMNHINMLERQMLEEQDIDLVKASGLDDVLEALSIGTRKDANAEKRVKAAYDAYEATKMAELKLQYPNLKYSQYKDMIFKAVSLRPVDFRLFSGRKHRKIPWYHGACSALLACILATSG
ncbi:Coiled-coil domain-containing protein [Babesia sp. Xinjiang]|uniref:Coiled-coil domain-containing protein n=1 Tax=Babesia sp. Xinjiang TaxID=462227 RepID=UPI000A23D4A6|nr:Coiled-coil domain-containing protein [Babesia sp. Xinjiang]ORM40710.1 Coiled-coil domain-containing protein [Babesia sp. Xinjiang]